VIAGYLAEVIPKAADVTGKIEEAGDRLERDLEL
jgi:hypothetical protein